MFTINSLKIANNMQQIVQQHVHREDNNRREDNDNNERTVCFPTFKQRKTLTAGSETEQQKGIVDERRNTNTHTHRLLHHKTDNINSDKQKSTSLLLYAQRRAQTRPTLEGM